MIKNCIICGKEFNTANKRTVCCSGECKKIRQKECFQKYLSNNKEKHATYCREYNKNHPEELSNVHKRFIENNPDKPMEYMRKFYKSRADKLNITVKELHSKIYQSRKLNKPIYELLGLSEEEYNKKIK